MGSKAITIVVLLALVVVGAYLIFGAIGRPAAQPAAAAPGQAGGAAAEQEVECVVCGRRFPRSHMREVDLESPGYAPDSYPVLVCSDKCEAAAKSDPDRYKLGTTK